jgi:hypothetical protein
MSFHMSSNIAVEHEDSVWSGTLDKTLQGMQIAARTLQALIAIEPNTQPPTPGP